MGTSPRAGPSWSRALLDAGAYVLLAVGLVGLLGQWAPGGLVWGGAVLFVGAAVPAWLLLAREGRPPAALGLPLDRWTPLELAKGTALGLGVAGAAVAVMAAAGGVRWVADEGSVQAFLAGGGALAATLALPALAEEVAVRGYLLQALARGFGPGAALVATSGLFALLHLGNPQVGWEGVLGIAAAGMMLGALVLRTGSLWWAAGVHLGWNWALAWPADLPVSGLELADTPGWDARLGGPAWISGGPFGPEASLLATAALGLVAWVIWRGPRPRPVSGRPALLDGNGWTTSEDIEA